MKNNFKKKFNSLKNFISLPSFTTMLLLLAVIIFLFNFNPEAFKVGADDSATPVVGSGTPHYVAKWVTPTVIPVIGVCGTANTKTYIYPAAGGYGSDTQCSPGTPDNSGAFPAPGGVAYWTCLGTPPGGVNDSPVCSAAETSSGSGSGSGTNGYCGITHYSCNPSTNHYILGTNVEGISGWTWSCPNGTPSGASCPVELKKKPVYQEN